MKHKSILVLVILTLGAQGCGGKAASPESTRESTVETSQPQKPKSSDEFRRNPLKSIRSVTLSVQGHRIKAYVADDREKEAEGLMFVTASELGEDDGMIFVFDEPSQQKFWMKNTIIPLDIAYLKPDGEIVNILTMKPLDESEYPSAGPAQYAVEMNAGWFERHQVKAGAKFDLSALNPHG